MDFQNVQNISIYGTDCIVYIERGKDNAAHFVSAKEKYFEPTLDDGTLIIKQKSRNIFYRIIMHKIEFTLTLPRFFKGKLRFRNKNGGLYVVSGDFTDVDLSTGNGKFEVQNASCSSFKLKMSNGAVTAKNITVAESTHIKCANGNIKVESVSSPEFTISCTNAALSAVDVTSKKFDCSTSNGAIDASGITAEDLRLESANGKISAVPLGARDDYKLSAETSHGRLIVDGVAYKKLADANHAKKRINAKTVNGDIDIRFM